MNGIVNQVNDSILLKLREREGAIRHFCSGVDFSMLLSLITLKNKKLNYINELKSNKKTHFD